MKEGMTLEQMAAEITRKAASKRDFKAPTTALTVLPPAEPKAPVTVAVGNEAFTPTEVFHNQLGTYTNIPAKYYDRMLANAPQLLATNANHWLHNQKETRLVRTLDGQARAFMSDRYRMIDDIMVAESILPYVIQQGNELGLRVESCNVSETRLYIKLVSEAITAKAVGDVVRAGVVISNSEVGLHSFRVEEMSEVLSCLNGAIRPGSGLRKYHVGRGHGEIEDAFEVFADDTRRLSDQALMGQMRDVVRAAFNRERFEEFAGRITSISGNKIEAKPEKAIDAVIEQFALPESLHAPILTMLAAKYQPTQWGLANAITEVAQNPEMTYEESTQLERVGGQLIELPSDKWEVISTAA